MSSLLLTVLSVARVGVLLLGLAVAVRAFWGYRTGGPRPLLYFGVAFLLISLEPLVVLVAGTMLDAATVGYVSLASDAVAYGVAFGLVLYALYRL